MKYLSIDQIIKQQEELISKFGGSYGIRDIGLIESAYYNSIQSFDGIDLYPTIEEKITSIAFGLSRNHPFIDGNKRISVHVLILNLLLNDIDIEYTQEELIELGLNMAQEYTKDDILNWVNSHKQSIE